MFEDLKKISKESEKEIDKIEDIVKKLREENKYLKSEKYKDTELKIMRQKLDDVYNDMNRGFPITKEENKEILKWCDEHDKMHQSQGDKRGGYYTYEFSPCAGLGIIGEVKCSCGEKFIFQNV